MQFMQYIQDIYFFKLKEIPLCLVLRVLNLGSTGTCNSSNREIILKFDFFLCGTWVSKSLDCKFLVQVLTFFFFFLNNFQFYFFSKWRFHNTILQNFVLWSVV